MTRKQLINQFIDFMSMSPTPFHAVDSITEILKNNGFSELEEKDRWKLKKKGKYYVTRGGSSIIAFKMGNSDPVKGGFHVVGAHTDSPSLKIKANPEKKVKNYLSLGVEVYGGPILSTWFDRELSIAGRVSFLGKNNRLDFRLLDFKRPVGIIPNLAIHLSSKKNEKQGINKQTELPPLIMQFDPKSKVQTPDFKRVLKTEMNKQNPGIKISEIMDYDLYFYDPQPPARVGLDEDFIAGSRLDNLLSCFIGLKAIVDSDSKIGSMLVCNDHEEVGSNSYTGAAGPFLKAVMERICTDKEDFLRMVSQSILISADNAHGIHPNYRSMHDENHGPILNQGPVIKLNANQRYATNSETSAFFRSVCKLAKVPVQNFINRSDLACGSTIGPITATTLGIKTLDIGAPTFAMHSIRETCGAEDIWHLYKALKKTFEVS